MIRSGKLLILAFLFGATCTIAGTKPTGSTLKFERAREAGRKLFRDGHYASAMQIYRSAYEWARAEGDQRQSILFLTNVMSCRFALLEYREAAVVFRKAEALATAEKDYESLAILATNMSSVYAHQGDFSAAGRMAQEARAAFRHLPDSSFWPCFLLQESQVYSGQNLPASAIKGYKAGIEAAQKLKNGAMEARGWELLGSEQWRAKVYPEADEAFRRAVDLEAQSHPEPSPDLERRIGLLRQSEGAQEEALQQFDRAVAQGRKAAGALPVWLLYYERGSLLMEMGKRNRALQDLEIAISDARKWRRTVLPSSTSADRADVGLHDLYAHYLEAGYAEWRETQSPALLKRMLQASEESRALSLQRTMSPALQWQNQVPERYWDLAGELRHLYMESVQSQAPEREARIENLEGQLQEMELNAGLELPSDIEELKLTEPGSQQLLGSFHLSEESSFLFAVTNEGIALYRLPGQKLIEAQAELFRSAVSNGSSKAEAAGTLLYTTLFGQLPAALLAKPEWILALDGNLYETPLAALIDPANGQFLIQMHAVETVPGLGFKQPPVIMKTGLGRFVGIADPVFHPGDPRWKAARVKLENGAPLLPRLPGTEREVAACRRVWRGNTQLLTGNDVSVASLRLAAEQNPEVLHFATHLVQPAGHPEQSLIALGAGITSKPEYLSVSSVARLHSRPTLVVMNGCSSGAGKAMASAGWLGLTRAWLMAGAQNVVASNWTVPDDGSQFFSRFYINYQQLATASPLPVANALRQTQLEMLKSGTWRAQPRYWAAYYVTARS